MAAIELYSTPLYSESSLKAYYRYSSGALTTDTTAGGHTLTAISDPAEDASGKFAGAVALDGNDAYSVADHADFKPTGAFSVVAWIKTSTTGAEQTIAQSYAEGSSKMSGWLLRIAVANKVLFRSGKNTGSTAGTDYQNITGGTTVTDGAYHLIVAVWDTTKLYLYVDGNSDASAVNWANAPSYQATNYVRFGCECDTGTNISFITGSLDDVSIFNGKALSATEVSKYYNGTWTSIKKVGGVAYASIKKINGVAIASVKKVAGLA